MADTEGKRNIMIAVDGSEHSEKAFDWYKEHIAKDGDFVIIMHALEPISLPSLSLASPASFPADQWHSILKNRADTLADLEKKYESKLYTNKISGKFLHKCAVKDVGPTICQEAKDSNVAYIVMGCRGLGLVRRTVLGSVSDYVLRHVNLPVTVVPK